MAERRRSASPDRLPRALHPVAWWVWAIALATAASRTTNPLLLGLIIVVAAFVVSERRSDAPWARGFRGYLLAGLLIVVLRVVYRILFGGDYGDHVLVTLPEIPLPDWAVGVTLGGIITLESVLAAAYDGLRLATLIICIGAANVLADPRRLLRSVPSALYEMGATLVVAVSVAPQLAESVGPGPPRTPASWRVGSRSAGARRDPHPGPRGRPPSLPVARRGDGFARLRTVGARARPGPPADRCARHRWPDRHLHRGVRRARRDRGARARPADAHRRDRGGHRGLRARRAPAGPDDLPARSVDRRRDDGGRSAASPRPSSCSPPAPWIRPGSSRRSCR